MQVHGKIAVDASDLVEGLNQDSLAELVDAIIVDERAFKIIAKEMVEYIETGRTSAGNWNSFISIDDLVKVVNEAAVQKIDSLQEENNRLKKRVSEFAGIISVVKDTVQRSRNA